MLKTKIKTTIQIFTLIDFFTIFLVRFFPFRCIHSVFKNLQKKQHLHQLHKNNATKSKNTDNIVYIIRHIQQQKMDARNNIVKK